MVAALLAGLVGAQPDMRVADVAHDGLRAVALCDSARPDVVLMDVAMPVMDGISATRRIRKSSPEAAVLVLTAYAGDEHVGRAVAAGARGFLRKDCTPEDLVAAIRAVHRGETVLPGVHGEGHHVGVRTLAPANHNARDLTERETEVVRALAQAKSSRQIASELHISERTARNHIQNVYKKLRISGRTQVVLYAVRKGLVDPYSAEL